ncbi:MAG: Oxidoreductase, aldo/keto reductase family, partial [uncultured Acetobacteraceae bacterium]
AHHHPPPRPPRPCPPRHRPRLHGHVRLLRVGRRRREPRHHRGRPRRRHRPVGHRRLLRLRPQRDAARPRPAEWRPARPCLRAGEVRSPPRPGGRLCRHRRAPGGREELPGHDPAPARHRPRGPVPARPRGPGGADRGHGGRHRRPRARRLRAPHRPFGGGAGHDPAGPRHPPDHRPPDRVLSDEPRHRSRHPADLPRTRHRHQRLRRAGAWAAQRFRARRPVRLPLPLAALPGRERSSQPGAGGGAAARGGGPRRDSGAARHRLGVVARRRRAALGRRAAAGPAGRGAGRRRPRSFPGGVGRDRGRRARRRGRGRALRLPSDGDARQRARRRRI